MAAEDTESPAKKQKCSDEMQLYSDVDVVWGKLLQQGFTRDTKEIPFDAVNLASSLSYITDQELEEVGQFLLQGGTAADLELLEIGCGLARPLRYICHKTGCKGVGTEYIPAYVTHSNALSMKCGLGETLKTVQGDIIAGTTEPELDRKFDGMVTVLCVCHLPGSLRDKVWSNTASMLKPNTRFFVHDFYARGDIPEESRRAIGEQGLAPDLPTKEEYIRTLEQQGFKDIVFEDATAIWSERVNKRHKDFASEETKAKMLNEAKLSEKTYNSLLSFYTFVITHVFPPGGKNSVGGCIIKGVRR